MQNFFFCAATFTNFNTAIIRGTDMILTLVSTTKQRARFRYQVDLTEEIIAT